jgi:hypothetical protein
MEWIQTKYIDKTYQRFRRFKCNRCGTTAEVLFDTSGQAVQIPSGWNLGSLEGSHLCPACESVPLKKTLLRVLN